MSAENLRTGTVRPNVPRDPRDRLVREKYFSLRPRPLERWLWTQGISAAPERVFWLHWQEGLKRGDWCSEIPIRRVAAECQLDVSTVTRAYQALARLGCLRRTDPGRDPANPFQQATAVTEVRIPRELLVELDRHPNRRARDPASSTVADCPPMPDPIREEPAPNPRAQAGPGMDPTPAPAPASRPPLRGRDRVRRLSALKAAMSPAERRQYDEAFRTGATHLTFDPETQLAPAARAEVLQLLGALANASRAPRAPRLVHPPDGTTIPSAPRRLSNFELARLRREIQGATHGTAAAELLRQVVWSIEEGALKRFSPNHASHIALKKIREGAWTRPNRMPPNWARGLGAPSGPDTCRFA